MDTNTLKMLIGSMVRHGATVFAGYLVANGFADKSQEQQIVGAVMTVAVLAWSWWQKKGHADTVAMLNLTEKRLVNQTYGKNAAKTAIAFLALSLAYPIAAKAADPAPVSPSVTAPAPASVCPPICSGFYGGVNLTGDMISANVLGQGFSGSLAGGGQNLGGQIGWRTSDGKWYFGVEASGDYTLLGNANVTGGSPPKYLFQQGIKIGASLASILNLGSQTPVSSPSIPTQLAQDVISPYVYFGAAERNWGTGFATGAGVEFALTPTTYLDTRYTYITYGSGANVSPSQSIPGENLVTVGVNWKLPF